MDKKANECRSQGKVKENLYMCPAKIFDAYNNEFVFGK